jgi:hypothetical protein
MGNLHGKNCFGSFNGARAKITPQRYLEVTSELKTAIIGFSLLLRLQMRSSRKRGSYELLFFSVSMSDDDVFWQLDGPFDVRYILWRSP